MKHRVLPAILQAFLLAMVATSARAQSQLDERIKEWQSRSVRVTSQLAPTSSIAKEYGLADVLRQLWGPGGWESESRTTHWYRGRLRSESFDETWAAVQWIPSSFTTYRPDGLVDTIKEWDSVTNAYVPGSRYLYEFFYDLFTGQAVPGSVVAQSWNGIDWQNSERTTYTIDRDPSTGLYVAGGLYEIWDDRWVPTSDYHVEQVVEDVVQTSREWDEGVSQWRLSERTIFTSTTISELYKKVEELEKEFESFEDLTISLLAVPDYEVQTWGGSAGWIPSHRRTTTHFHFATGRPALVLYEVWTGQWTESARHQIEYNLYGRADKSSLIFQGFEGMEVGEDTYTYDDRGVMTQSVTTWTGGGQTEFVARRMMSWTELMVSTEDAGEIPASHRLHPAYPNPFNPSTTIGYELATTDRINISVFDVLGKQVAELVDGEQSTGRHEVVFDASGLPGGLYVVRMKTSTALQARPVTLLK